ncbi:NAD(P)H-binding protein [Telmatocola sphagniphila]|uniref:NAD(P)H-binding protein n=1 Tax=Telmatocola sphagniphila TaxID=1123043 RepID=A0A8E6BCB2_9BACT|nr:NAD(P)H-binding protein [Telmatocola sphagniphila]QVL34265.1 NAD(P)H-binding protein [Telmatocola sphagniphila]
MILFSGATGLVGGAVVQELLQLKTKNVRALCRNSKDASKIPTGAEVVYGDFSDLESLEKALSGIDSAYLVCAAIPDLVELESNFLQACKKLGTRHVVIQSALGAADFPKSFPSWHRQVEDIARTLKVPHTILRPNGFLQNIGTYFAPSIRTQDCFYGMIGESRISLVDIRDIALAAALLLSLGSPRNQIFELFGPEALSNQEIAQRISNVTGRNVTYINLSEEQILQGMVGAGIPGWRARAIAELDEYYLSGKGAGSDDVLQKLIGRSPRTLDAYLAENVSVFDQPK